MQVELLLLIIVITGIVVSFIYTAITGISPVSSTRKSRNKIISSVPADTKGIIYELGAAWGALAFPLARRCPDAKIIAYELSPFPWMFMKLRHLLGGPKNLELKRANFLHVPLSDADLIVCYLHPGAMKRLAPKLDDELKPSATAICNTFELPDCTPSLIEKLDDVMCPQILTYHPVQINNSTKHNKQ